MKKPGSRATRAASVVMVAASMSLMATVAFAPPSGAVTSGGITVRVGTAKVHANILVTVPVRVVCASFGGTWVTDSIQVNLLQANGNSVSSGTEYLGRGGVYGTGSPLFVCDGTTLNVIRVPVLPNAGSGPFNPGQAVITVTVNHAESTGGASATLGPKVVTLS